MIKETVSLFSFITFLCERLQVLILQPKSSKSAADTTSHTIRDVVETVLVEPFFKAMAKVGAQSKMGIDLKNRANYQQIFVLENIYWLTRSCDKQLWRPKGIAGQNLTGTQKELEQVK